jgi:hypothetical protein
MLSLGKREIVSREEAVVADVTNRRVIGRVVAKRSNLLYDQVSEGV